MTTKINLCSNATGHGSTHGSASDLDLFCYNPNSIFADVILSHVNVKKIKFLFESLLLYEPRHEKTC